MADLKKYADGEYVREATEAERQESLDAAKRDGGVGAITVEIDGESVTCYVED